MGIDGCCYAFVASALKGWYLANASYHMTLTNMSTKASATQCA